MAQRSMTPYRPAGIPDYGFGREPFSMFRREVDRLIDDVFGGGTGLLPRGGNGGNFLSPNIDVSETDNEIKVRAELPGVAEKDIVLTLKDDILTIKGEKRSETKEEKENYYFAERSFGSFQRSLRLPYPANPDKVQARFENGVLNVSLPKGEEQARVRRIQVQGGGKRA